jgi:hypothetical protein
LFAVRVANSIIDVRVREEVKKFLRILYGGIKIRGFVEGRDEFLKDVELGEEEELRVSSGATY